jgi:hypothetical protein
MQVPVETFEQAAQLDTTELRALLVSDHPERRVWAIWALALREDGLPELAQRTAIEHNPGVRRTLAVVLASHGETDLLVALARHDPALVVRASAMQLVTRLAAGGAIDPSVVVEAAQREPEIQLAILTAINASPPAFVLDIASRLLEHGVPAVQVEAFELLVRAEVPARTTRAVTWLCDASDESIADGCRRWLSVAASEVVARWLASSPLRVRKIALRQLPAPSWPIVEQLVSSDLCLLVEHVLNPMLKPPVRILAQLVLECPGIPALRALRRRLWRMKRLPQELGPMVPDLCRCCTQRLEALRQEDQGFLAQAAIMSILDSDGFQFLVDACSPNSRFVERDELARLLAQLDPMPSS